MRLRIAAAATLGLVQVAHAIHPTLRAIVLDNLAFSNDTLDGLVKASQLEKKFTNFGEKLRPAEHEGTQLLKGTVQETLDRIPQRFPALNIFIDQFAKENGQVNERLWRQLTNKKVTTEDLNRWAHMVWFHQKLSEWSIETEHKYMQEVNDHFNHIIYDKILANVPETETSANDRALGSADTSKLTTIFPPFVALKFMQLDFVYRRFAGATHNRTDLEAERQFLRGVDDTQEWIAAIYQAMWEEGITVKENILNGHALVSILKDKEVTPVRCGTGLCLNGFTDEFRSMYLEWNHAFMHDFSDSFIMTGSYFFPNIMKVDLDDWALQRVQSLTLVTKLYVMGKMQGKSDGKLLTAKGLEDYNAKIYDYYVGTGSFQGPDGAPSFFKNGEWIKWTDIHAAPPRNNDITIGDLPENYRDPETANWFTYLDAQYPVPGPLAKAREAFERLKAVSGAQTYFEEVGVDTVLRLVKRRIRSQVRVMQKALGRFVNFVKGFPHRINGLPTQSPPSNHLESISKQ